MARWALPISRSLISARRSQSRQIGDVVPLDVGVLGPRQEPDQPRTLGGGHLRELGGRDQILGIVEDDSQADPLGRVCLHENALDELVEQGEDHVRVAGPGFGLADPFGEQARASGAGGRRRRRRRP